MKRKLTYILLTLVTLLSSPVNMMAEETWIEVSTAQQLMDALGQETVNIRLTADIDISSITPTDNAYYSYWFKGTLDGAKSDGTGCYAIKNGKAALLWYLEGATVRNLIISDFNISYKSGEARDAVGALSIISKDGTVVISNVTAKNVNVTADEENAGCIIGYATDTQFINCYTDRSCGVWCDGTTTYDAFAGGICGYAMNCSFANCVNKALVTGDGSYIGGIAGWMSNSTARECINEGWVLHISDDDMSTYESIRTQLSTTSYDDVVYNPSWCSGSGWSAPDEVGGIAGHAENGSKISACSNYGFIQSADAYAGGIVGYLKDSGSQVSDCINLCAIQAGEQVGGIVGCNDNSTVTRCVNMGTVTASPGKSTVGSIQGDKKNDNATCNNNFRSSSTDFTDGTLSKFTAKSGASGALAAKLNALDGDAPLWHQTIGTDLYPLPYGSGSPITESDKNEEANIWQEISAPGALQRALCQSCSHVKLADDIDFNGNPLVCSSSCISFQGALDGQGHSLNKITNTSDKKLDGTGIFPCAADASFKNFTLSAASNTCTDDATQNGLLVGSAVNCTFDGITVARSTITTRADYTGCLAGSAVNGSFNNCNIRSSVTVTVNDDDSKYAGGLVGKWSRNDAANQSLATSCVNAATIKVANYGGGFVGECTSAKFYCCMNEGTVSSSTNEGACIGGFVGSALASCVFEGCLTFGMVTKSGDDNGCFYGQNSTNDATLTNSAYYITVNEKLKTGNNGLYASPDADNLKSGEYTYKLNQTLGSTKWYQSLDIEWGYDSDYPIPLSGAGTVYSNTQCDGGHIYSNLYWSEGTHEPVCNEKNTCTVCGKKFTNEVTNYVELKEALKLKIEDITVTGTIMTPYTDEPQTLDLNGCTVTGSSGQDGYELVAVRCPLTITDTSEGKNGSITVTNNTNAVVVGRYNAGKLTLNAGTIKSTGCTPVYVFGNSTMDINGGTIENTSSSDDAVAITTRALVTITGGTIVGKLENYNSGSDNPSWNIIGGKFSCDPSAMLNEHYIAVKNDGYWYISLDGSLYIGDCPSFTLFKGKEKSLRATEVESEALSKTFTWTSSDETVATVTSSGVVTAVGQGVANITVSDENGDVIGTSRITVYYDVMPGKFTVNADGKQVEFARTNLYWDGSDYKFETKQTDFVDWSESYTWPESHVGQFMWTSYKDYTSGNADYMPYNEFYKSSDDCSLSDELFCAEQHPLTVDGIDGLYAMSIDEWNYLLKTRTNASSLYKCNVTIGTSPNTSNYCLVIAPDDYDFTTNPLQSKYTTIEDVEELGLICLPAAGKKEGYLEDGNVTYVYPNYTNEYGYYLTSTPKSASTATGMYFQGGVWTWTLSRYEGLSLRLVKNVSTALSLNSYGYATFSTSHDVEVSGCNAYTVHFEGDKLMCSKITDGKIPAYTGVLLYGDPNATVSMTMVDNAPTLENNDLKPTTTSTGLAAKVDSYTLSGDTFKTFKGASYNSNKAYLPMSAYKGSSADAKFTIFFDDILPTGISEVSTTVNSVKNAKIISGGRLVIIHGDKQYNASGVEIK